jgi:hypothetical protein
MNEIVSRSASVLLRLVLYRGEVYRVPPVGRGVRILRGRAWVTYAGEDILLARGDEACLASTQGAALVSAVGCAPLVLEVLGRDCRLRLQSYVLFSVRRVRDERLHDRG